MINLTPCFLLVSQTLIMTFSQLFYSKRMVEREDELKDFGIGKMVIYILVIIAIENNKYNPILELAMKLAKLLDTPVEDIFQLDE